MIFFGGCLSAAQLDISIYLYKYLFKYVICVLLHHLWYVGGSEFAAQVKILSYIYVNSYTCMYVMYVQTVVFGMSSNLNIQSKSHGLFPTEFTPLLQKICNEQEHRLRFEKEMILQMQ